MLVLQKPGLDLAIFLGHSMAAIAENKSKSKARQRIDKIKSKSRRLPKLLVRSDKDTVDLNEDSVSVLFMIIDKSLQVGRKGMSGIHQKGKYKYTH